MRIVGSGKKFRPTVQMGRMSGGVNREWSLRIEDETSGVQLMELRITDEELGSILGTSQTVLQADATIYASSVVGKVREHKTESFDDPAKGDYSEKATAKRIKHAESLESDGWLYTGNHNSQGYVKEGKVHARYVRWD